MRCGDAHLSGMANPPQNRRGLSSAFRTKRLTELRLHDQDVYVAASFLPDSKTQSVDGSAR
jgi:hypothetical protein